MKGVQLVDILQEPFVARFRHHLTIGSKEWVEADFSLVKRGEKYRFVNKENGQPLELFVSRAQIWQDFEAVQLVHTATGTEEYLIFYLDDVRYYVWREDENGVFDMENCSWDIRKQHKYSD